MINEVKIIREELRHANIVSYYRIFAESKIEPFRFGIPRTLRSSI